MTTDRTAEIVFWDLNTLFPALQLFFDSGLSCTIEGSQLPGALVGLDPILRFRLTNATHQEQGQISKGLLPEKFVRSSGGIRILRAAVATRTSTRVRSRVSTGQLLPYNSQGCDIVQEVHTVVGLQLSGMSEMGYIWAKAGLSDKTAKERGWGDVRLVGMRDDVPAPFWMLAANFPKDEGEVEVVNKNSMIKLPCTRSAALDEFGRPWI